MSLHIQLNIQTITDEMMALTALRSLSAPGDRPSAPLLTRDQLPALRVVARMVFADILLTLGGAVEKSCIDGEDGGEALPYDESQPMTLEVTFRTSGSPVSGAPLLVKRQLEHAVAAGVLGWVASPTDASFAAHLAAQRDAAADAVAAAVGGGAAGCGAPFSVPGWP